MHWITTYTRANSCREDKLHLECISRAVIRFEVMILLCSVLLSPRHGAMLVPRSKSVSVTLDVLTTCLRLKRTCSTLEYGA